MDRTVRSAKTKIFGAILLVVLAIPMGVWLAGKTENNPKPSAVKASHITVAPPKQAKISHLQYPGQDGKTALAILKSRAQVQTKTSAYGEMVTSINGQDGGGDKYWMFYVDGQQASEGAGTYVTKNGQMIEWKLQ